MGNLTDSSTDAGVLQQERPKAPSASPLGAVLDSFAASLFVVEGDRKVVYMNRAAAQCTSEHEGFLVMAGYLCGVRSGTTHRLDQALKAVCGRHASQDAFQVDRGSHDLALQVSVSALTDTSPDRGTRRPATALLTANRVRDDDYDEKTLRALFGLSKSEAALLKRMLAGKTIEQCARERGVAVCTARSQLSSIFAKTNTTHQAQLIAVAKTLPVTTIRHGDGPAGDDWVMV